MLTTACTPAQQVAMCQQGQNAASGQARWEGPDAGGHWSSADPQRPARGSSGPAPGLGTPPPGPISA
eukprot:7767358-Lingulodinium_polyedra.AAC.1